MWTERPEARFVGRPSYKEILIIPEKRRIVPLICPSCNSSEFKIIDAIEVGRDGYWDERTVQRARCPVCDRRFMCIYREKRSFSERHEDEVDHVAYVNRSRLWSWAGFIFTKPSRKRSAPWRVFLLRKLVLKRCVGDHTNPELRIIYDAKR